MEWIRRQVADIKMLMTDAKNTDVVKACDEAEAKLVDIEGNLIQLKITPQGQGGTRWTAMIVEKLGYLANAVETADFPPADQHKEVHQVLKKRLADNQARFNQFLEKDLPVFQEALKKGGITGPIILKK